MKRLMHMLSLDLRALALLRIAYGIILLQDLAIRVTDLSAHYTDWGLAPRSAVLDLETNPAFLCIHMLNGTWPFQAFLFAIGAAAALCVAVGYRTRLSSLICYIHLASLHSRNPVIEDGGDTLIRVVFFWCLFLPWGARWSIDAHRTRKSSPQDPDVDPPENRWFDVATVAYMIQLSTIYVFAAILKTHPVWRVDGTAVQYALMIDQLTTPLAPLLLAHPPWMRFLNFATLGFEALGPILFWLPGPFRLLGALGISGMHAGFGLFMHLGVFCPIGMFSPVGLWPSFVFNRWERTRLYAWMGSKFGELAEKWPLPGYESSHPRALGAVITGLLIYLVSCVLLYNAANVPDVKLPIRPPQSVLCILRLDQGWNMFAPKPLDEDGWFVIDAEQVDGTHIDLFQNGAPVKWTKPADVASTYRNARWRKFMMNIWAAKMWNWRLYYGRYLTRWWNESHSGPRQVKTFQICFMLTVNQADGTKKPVEKNVIWTHQCFDESPTSGGVSKPGEASPSPTPAPTSAATAAPVTGGKPAASATPGDPGTGSMPRT